MRKLALVAALAAVALGASACDLPATDYAAEVGGTTITSATVTSTVSGVGGDSDFSCVLSSSGSGITASGKGPNSIGTTFAAALLTDLIHAAALRSELAAEHLGVSALARELATDQLASEMAPENSQDQAACPSFAFGSLDATYRDALVELQADQDVLYAHKLGFDLTTPGFRAYAAAHGGLYRERCLTLVAFKSQGSAKTAAAAIAHGTSIAVAGEQNGGSPEAGCVQENQIASLPAPLDTLVPKLKLGVVSAPVSVEGEYLLVALTAIKAVPLADDALELLGIDATVFAQGTSGFDLSTLSAEEAHFAAPVLDHEKVAISPTYGTWQKVGGNWKVVPPAAPPSSLLSNAGAVGNTGSTGAPAGTTGG
ncbi:MAG TPA: hypothetical protein VMD59_07540 [Acidimicrobiales bacterium]|nr:hypothetical protein [Acidimicrobiales bacterium]